MNNDIYGSGILTSLLGFLGGSVFLSRLKILPTLAITPERNPPVFPGLTGFL
ncbi:MAG: hypothetical protein NTW79_00925 [Candidatus Berkelbacteria bacterium]|nr:hypothetical protein [Candidatus Berkelbacteria bacterium]